jgi:hypothetical protein
LNWVSTLFAKTNAQWPPVEDRQVFHPTSAHQVVVKALAQRKLNKTDEQGDNTSEVWRCTVLPKN